jgi:hypothetical protein
MVPDAGGLGKYTDDGLAVSARPKFLPTFIITLPQGNPRDGTETIPDEFKTPLIVTESGYLAK